MRTNTLNKVFQEISNLKANIDRLKIEEKNINKKMNQWEHEFMKVKFDSAEGYFLYTGYRDFLQERRLLKSQIEELQVQYEILGGDSVYNGLKNAKDIKTYRRYKKQKKSLPRYNRKINYFKNFRPDLKEKVDNMYHIR